MSLALNVLVARAQVRVPTDLNPVWDQIIYIPGERVVEDPMSRRSFAEMNISLYSSFPQGGTWIRFLFF